VSFFVRTRYEKDPAMPEGTEASTAEVSGAYATRESAIDAAEQTAKQVRARHGEGARAVVEVIGEDDEVLWETRADG